MSSGEVLIPIIAIIGFFGSVITFIYMRYKSKHQQRMALIDSGKTAEIFSEKNLNERESGLKNGLFLIGIGGGFMIGRIIESMFDWPEATGIIPACLIGGGSGLVLFYSLLLKRDRDYD